MASPAKKVWNDIVTPAKVGLVVSLLAYGISFSELKTVRENGVITTCTYSDIGAMMMAVGIAAAAFFTVQDGRKGRNPQLNYALAGVLVMFAVIHMLRGLGIVGGPCN